MATQTLNPSAGISIQQLIAAGIPYGFIEPKVKANVKLADIVDHWKQEQARAEVERLKAENAALASMDDRDAALLAEIERLKADNNRLRTLKASAQVITPKVSEKGAVSVYGLGKWPVTLYKSQWLRLLANADKIRAFIDANDSQLKQKED